MATAQTLEWLQLLAAAAGRQRTQALLDNAIAARGGQATPDGFRDFTGSLKTAIKRT